MKKILMTITLAFAMSAGVQAQDTTMTGYRSFFGSESTVWYVGREILDDINLQNLVLRITDDTLVDNTNYRKIYMSYRWSEESTGEGRVLVGLCREDTLNGRLWLKDLYYNTDEILIADMSNEMGDANVDTVYYDTLGRKIIVKNLPYYPRSYRVIEGVGPEYVDNNVHYGGLFFTVCVYHDNQKIPFVSSVLGFDSSHLNYETCWIVQSQKIANTDCNEKVVYPNPCTNYVIINGVVTDEVALYDFYGKKIKTQKGNVARFDMSCLNSGVYLLKITTVEGTIVKTVLKK